MSRHLLPRAFVGVAFLATMLVSAPGFAKHHEHIYVGFGPPAAIIETRPVTPGRGYVWTPGYYSWDGRAYNWNRGRWVVTPRNGVTWVAPRWHRERRGWYIVDGHWR